MDSYENMLIERTLNQIERSTTCANYFFRNEELKSLTWFKPLLEAGWFNCKSEVNDGGKPLKLYYHNERSVHYSTPFWKPLWYLERIPDEIYKLNNEYRDYYINELINIIIKTSDFLIKGKTMEYKNYQIIISFIEIIDKLEEKDIPLKIINYCEKWINFMEHEELVFSFINDKILPKIINNEKKLNRFLEMKIDEYFKRHINNKLKELTC